MIQDLSIITTKYNEGNQELKIAIIRSNYHQELTKSLEEKCREYLIASGVEQKNISTFEVPGSWEIPLVVSRLALSKKFDGIVALGVIIKGETYHFEVIANECARALMNISLEFNIPITCEILATYNLRQAKERSLGKYNKGTEAAKTILETIRTISKL